MLAHLMAGKDVSILSANDVDDTGMEVHTGKRSREPPKKWSDDDSEVYAYITPCQKIFMCMHFGDVIFTASDHDAKHYYI
jgi:hypothetical protein